MQDGPEQGDATKKDATEEGNATQPRELEMRRHLRGLEDVRSPEFSPTRDLV